METTLHLLWDCPVAKDVWSWLCDCWNDVSHYRLRPSVRLVLFGQAHSARPSKSLRRLLPIWDSVHGEALLSLWLCRNDAFFEKHPFDARTVINRARVRMMRGLSVALATPSLYPQRVFIDQLEECIRFPRPLVG